MKKRTKRILRRASEAVTIAAGVVVAESISAVVGRALKRGARVAKKGLKKSRKKARQR